MAVIASRALLYPMAAAIVAVAVAGGCGSAGVPTTTSGNGAPRSSVIPGVAPAPHWPIPGIDAGNTLTPSPGPDGVIDKAWGWGSLEWSPDGRTLAAAAESQEWTEGQIHLFDRRGRPIGAVPGWDATWIDDHDLMTLETNADGVLWSAWRWSSDAKSSALVMSGAIALLGNAHGAIAIKLVSTGGHESYRIWRNGRLTPILPGSPTAWSSNGNDLAVLRDAPTSTPGGTGNVGPAWLEVIDGSDLHQIAAFPADTFDPRTVLLFDSSGSSIASSEFVFDLAPDVAYALPKGSEFVAWAEDGSALIASLSDHTIARWDRTSHTLSPPLERGTRIGTSDGRSVTIPAPTADLPLQLVTPGVVSPDRELRAWYPLADGRGDTPLRLVGAGS